MVSDFEQEYINYYDYADYDYYGNYEKIKLPRKLKKIGKKIYKKLLKNDIKVDFVEYEYLPFSEELKRMYLISYKLRNDFNFIIKHKNLFITHDEYYPTSITHPLNISTYNEWDSDYGGGSSIDWLFDKNILSSDVMESIIESNGLYISFNKFYNRPQILESNNRHKVISYMSQIIKVNEILSE